jgi:site-specific DNA-methyltransferase (adenine-specific)
MDYTLHHGDCLEVMATMADNSVDAIVTDPPYGLSFMGNNWDHGVPGEAFWREALRVAKPGAHLLAFGGTRTFHRLAVAIEDAGWEMRDTIGMPHESGEWGDCPWLLAWVYGSGFPKSLDVSKAIDKAAGAEREVVGVHHRHSGGSTKSGSMSGGELGTASELPLTAPATPEAQQWDGWGTALKPAWEPVIVARKPLVGTVAENVLTHGTGALNVDGCRVATDDPLGGGAYATKPTERDQLWGDDAGNSWRRGGAGEFQQPPGRWPANLIHDGSDEVVGLFPLTASHDTRDSGGLRDNAKKGDVDFKRGSEGSLPLGRADSGSAARFFYCAKASKADRDEGCDGLEARRTTFADGTGLKNNGDGTPRNQQPSNRNHHPTVKPTSLMSYLCRLVTPPGGIVLDPFMGSGSTGKAAILEGFQFIGIEREAEYLAIAEARISHASGLSQPPQRPTRQPAPACPGQLALF